jgi:RHS repeat-associated protein
MIRCKSKIIPRASGATTDIDNQALTINYEYDGAGNLKKDTSEALNVTWSPYGKVLEAKRFRTAVPAVNISTQYGYDPMQNRVLKLYINGTDSTKTYYIRDAQGNTMAVYTRRKDTLVWAEQHLYGSSRLGTWEPNQRLTPSVDTTKKWHLLEGQKRYELTNHLGNVLVTINDRRQGVTFNATTKVYAYYEAVTIQATDYYPFGLEMPGRTFQAPNTSAYRFGFNDKENDRNGSWSGTQLVQDYGMRLYNPAIARFLSIDPITADYPELTPYQFASNTPIVGVDLDGLETSTTVEKQQAKNAPLLLPTPAPPVSPTPPPQPPRVNPPVPIGDLILKGLSYIGKGGLMTVAFVFAPPFDQMKTRSEFPPSYYSNIKLNPTTDPYQLTREKKADKYSKKKLDNEGDDEQPHILYKLVAKNDGIYPCPSCPPSEGGSIYLKKGETWKYGVTGKGSVEERYKGSKLPTGEIPLDIFRPIKIASGSESRMKIAEKRKTVGYYNNIENLDRENKTGLRLYRPPGQVRDK